VQHAIDLDTTSEAPKVSDNIGKYEVAFRYSLHRSVVLRLRSCRMRKLQSQLEEKS
jgi:hypothetical protein